MEYFFGIDAGATKTQCALAAGSEVIARAHGGSLKTSRVTEQEAARHLEEMLTAVEQRAGVGLASVTGTCVGLSGISIPSVAHWVRTALAARVGGGLTLCGDEEIALDAAFHAGRGILAIAGTGSHIVARTRDGRLVRTGGWGPAIGDQGAGSRIGLLALRAVFHAIDAGEETAMLPALHACWKTSTLEELVDVGNRMHGAEFSTLAPMVTACAAQGDAAARSILEQSGEELGELILLAMRKAEALEAAVVSGDRSATGPWQIATTGSIVEKVSLVRESMMAAVHRARPAAEFLPGLVDPPLGAVWRARAMYGAGDG
jgi:glucosamine kinase